MKKIFQLGLLSMLAVACVAERQEAPQLAAGDEELVAGIEVSATRTSVDETLQVLWDTGDCISVFRETVENRCYQLKGEGGVASGVFKSTETPSPSFSAELPYIIAVYPYSKDVTAYENGDVILTLPAEQAYASDSFGPGANTMVAVSEDKNLSFKNLCGFVAVQLQGDVAVNSITLRTNASEPIAGSATVETSLDGEPAVLMNIKGGNEIVMSCDEAVRLKPIEPTLFWFVVPPATYEDGFSIEVEYNDGYLFEMEGTQSQTVERNTLIKMAPLTITAPKTLPYLEPFDEANELGAFSIEDVTLPEALEYVWKADPKYGAKGSAYVNAAYEAESWLTSPSIDLTQEKQAVLTFDYTLRYGVPGSYEDQFYLMIDDGEKTTRVDIPGMPTVDPKFKWQYATVDLSKFCGKIIEVAFVYNSIDNYDANGKLQAPTIEVKNVLFDRNVKAVIDAPAILSLMVGDKGKAIEATVNSGAKLSYTSSDEKVATVDADGVVTPVAEGTATITVSAPATGIYGEAEATVEVSVVEPSPEYIYTSNVELSTEGGTSASVASVVIGNDTFDALKAGTGKVAGAMVITVPKGTTKLHLHAFGWKGESVTVSITGVDADPAEIVLVSDDGISNNSPFTLTTTEDSYHCVALTDVTDDTEITLTATKGKRFVVWGVNAE